MGPIFRSYADIFYLGTDGNCPSGEYDLESIILHEMGHGLGFLSNSGYDPYYKYGTIDQPTPFDAYAQLPDGRRLMDIPSPSLELGTAITRPLVWSGLNGIKANNGIKPAQIYFNWSNNKTGIIVCPIKKPFWRNFSIKFLQPKRY